MTDQMTAPQASAKARKGSDRAIHLTAKLDNGKVEIESDAPGKPTLPKDSGAHRFTFHLDDQTNLNVRFLDESTVLWIDESENCPPAKGINTDQVDPQSVTSTDKMAAFTDKNKGDPRTLCYQLNFECDDPSKHPITYDPIIINGGGR